MPRPAICSLVEPGSAPIRRCRDVILKLNMAEANEEVKAEAASEPEPDPTLVDTLPSGVKVKRRFPRQRACTEKNAKGKVCTGKLKRWYFFGDDIKQRFGDDAEIYRCATCGTLYLPNPEEEPRSGTLAW